MSFRSLCPFTTAVTLATAMLVSMEAMAKPETEATKVRVDTVASGLEHPWGLAFLPDGRMLVSERSGQLRLVKDGQVGKPLQGVPEVSAQGQCGLMDVVLHPKFAENQWVYFSFAEPQSRFNLERPGLGDNSTAVARTKFQDNALKDVEVIFRQQPKVDSSLHCGSRLVFAADGALFVTLGERNSQRKDAQTLDNHHGKVVRLADKGNPFTNTADAKPEIWSIGHRNIQGAALHPQTGELWTHEHGPQGGDEINIARAGRNYGWPVITYGKEYGGGRIGEGTQKTGMEQPLHYWVPSIAPSGMTFYTGERFPAWRGNLLVGSLKFTQLVRLELDGERVVHEERLLQNELGERIRTVVQGPDGLVYLLTDQRDGKIVRVSPAN